MMTRTGIRRQEQWNARVSMMVQVLILVGTGKVVPTYKNVDEK